MSKHRAKLENGGFWRFVRGKCGKGLPGAGGKFCPSRPEILPALPF
jgi:hypothetical protein